MTLQRRSPLKATASLARRTPLRARPKARKPPRDTGPSGKVRLAVYERDGWRCVCCGQSVIDVPHSIGHRKRRSQGGSHTPENLLTFLGLGMNPFDPDDHHARIDSRKDPRDEASGYTVRREQDPAEVPVMVFSEHGSGMTLYPREDGTYSTEPPERSSWT